jgi:ribosomal-protein-serine acetyltransferase
MLRSLLAVDLTVTDHSSSSSRRRDWRRGLPVLSDGDVVLRELRTADAPSLLAHLDRTTVLRYIDPCPSTIVGFERFIRWTREQRRRRLHACFAVTVAGERAAVGVIQLWPLERDFSTAEWGFVLSESYWGTGVFVRGACLFLDFVFDELGVFRLEARAVAANMRGNGVLRKLGAMREGTLRAGFHNGEGRADHVMWSMLAPEWQRRRNRFKLVGAERRQSA